MIAPVLALALIMLQACSAVGLSKNKRPQSPAPAATPSLRTDPVTIENLLRWPLEGAASKEKVIQALDRLFQMKHLRASQFAGQGPVRLTDGHILSFAYIRKLSGEIDIGVDPDSCVAPDWAAAITGASLNPVYQDAHGVDRGKQYDASGNGIAVRINTTPVTYRCVTAIHIYPLPK
ncbi:hypothetical protein ASD86_14360 [Lysobacter sp. Root690]|nr:hypothetical protein ASD86_14360 [Lysobacter sp. Root690]